MSRSSLSFFLLLLSFGILFAGCSPQPDTSFDEFTFTDTDLQTVETIAGDVASSSGMVVDDFTLTELSVEDEDVTVLTETSGSAGTVAPVSPQKAKFDALRTVVVDQGGNIYRVNNPYVNIRESMNVTSTLVERLVQGDIVTVLDIPNAEWAKVSLQSGKKGYVAFRYIAKLTTDQKLPEEKKQFDGKYFVDYQFLNIRKDPSTQSEKIGELPSQAIIKPISMNGEWARVAFEGKEGYVSTQYLKKFLPVFLVRQDAYQFPILQYLATDATSIGALPQHIAALKAVGKKIVTLRSLYDIVLQQETRDARMNPGTVALAITGVNAQNIRSVTDALNAAVVPATLFLQTKDIGIAGITEKSILTMLANGYELQSGGHTGDDLRSMTDSQVTLELSQSKKLLEESTKRDVYVVAYPKGGVNERILSQAADTGYLFGVSQSPDKKFSRSDFLRLPTLIVSSGMAAEDVRKLVE